MKRPVVSPEWETRRLDIARAMMIKSVILLADDLLVTLATTSPRSDIGVSIGKKLTLYNSNHDNT